MFPIAFQNQHLLQEQTDARAIYGIHFAINLTEPFEWATCLFVHLNIFKWEGDDSLFQQQSYPIQRAANCKHIVNRYFKHCLGILDGTK